MTPTKLALATALAALLALPALAESEGSVTAEAQAQITALLTGEGYEVRRIGMEDGFYEAYAVKDGHMYEIYLNAALDIVRTQED
jgi:hypothetical protein